MLNSIHMFKTLQHATCLGRTILNSSNKDMVSFTAARDAFMRCSLQTRVGAESIVFLKSKGSRALTVEDPTLSPVSRHKQVNEPKWYGNTTRPWSRPVVWIKNYIYFLLIFTIFLCGQGQSVLSTQFFSDCQDNSTRLIENTWPYQIFKI